MQSAIPPSIGSEIGVKRADWLNAKFVVDFREQEFVVVHDGNRVHVYDPRGAEQLGVIRIGSPFSGAIWKSGDCIAEYSQDASGQYCVLSIEKGFKCIDETHDVHPLVHLLRALTSR